MGHPELSGSTDGAAGLATAAPDTGTPTPPPPPPLGVAEAAVGQDHNQNRTAVNPGPVMQNESPDCLPVDHNLSYWLVCWFVLRKTKCLIRQRNSVFCVCATRSSRTASVRFARSLCLSIRRILIFATQIWLKADKNESRFPQKVTCVYTLYQICRARNVE
jgi:hypothetical protein